MLDWLKRHGATVYRPREREAETPRPQGRTMTGKYVLLYKYLENRYAGTVVLTFSEIEDLLGFSLPDQARLRQEWWTAAEAKAAGSNYSDSWILARRTAKPNLVAQNVVFERGA